MYLDIWGVLLLSGSYLYCVEEIEKQNELERIRVAKIEVLNLYKDEDLKSPLDNLTLNDIEKVELLVQKIKTKKEKNTLITITNDLKKYINIKEKINQIFKDNVLNSEVTEEEIKNIKDDYSKLRDIYQNLVISELNTIATQYDNILNVKNMVRALYNDDSQSTVVDTITRTQYEDAFSNLQSLPQKDLVAVLTPYLEKALNYIEKKEEEEKRRIAEEKTRLEEAYVVLPNVPYISQTETMVYNGCEMASLLMGLQYKGYLKNVSLQQMANDVPKHESDAYQGFVGPIFELEPRNYPHWIAPSALAKFGRDYSSYTNVIDITSASAEELKSEINQGNPIIVYVTGYFSPVRDWYYEVPNNFHVMLLIGYNKITGNYILHDPWSTATYNGRTEIDKTTFESIYNQIGKKAVVIR